jgi:hypothetical protein
MRSRVLSLTRSSRLLAYFSIMSIIWSMMFRCLKNNWQESEFQGNCTSSDKTFDGIQLTGIIFTLIFLKPVSEFMKILHFMDTCNLYSISYFSFRGVHGIIHIKRNKNKVLSKCVRGFKRYMKNNLCPQVIWVVK